MSGIVGIVNLDGSPVDRALLERMLGTMTARGPDAGEVWCSGHVGFGHALLRIPGEPHDEHQPSTLDGQVWITADARIDGRAELTRLLRAAGYPARNDAGDGELILKAYAAFGDSFLDRIIGDFAFALWDARSKELICARDHFGVRPFFYTRTDRVFLFASDIDALLEHPEVSTRLDDEAIGDFLFFGSVQSPELSVYRDVRRLPAGNQIRVKAGGVRLQPYWTLPAGSETSYRSHSEYIERFQELLGQAVDDRSRANRVVIELSGGLDSTSIAALLAPAARAVGRSVEALTLTVNEVQPDDQEGYYAEMTASHLAIPLSFPAFQRCPLFERFECPELRTAEPCAYPMLSARYDFVSRFVQNGSRVLLSGQVGDATFAFVHPYYLGLLRRGRVARLFTETYRHVRYAGSFAGMGLRYELFRRADPPPWKPEFPKWVDAEFAGRARLKDRWESGWRTMQGAVTAHDQLRAPWVSTTFDGYETLPMPFVARHPFADLRLVEFMLGLPNYLKYGKRITREAMRGKLPEPVRTRPKTGLGDYIREKFAQENSGLAIESLVRKHGNGYIDPERYIAYFREYNSGAGKESTWSSHYIVGAIALCYWLARRTKHNDSARVK